MFRKFAALGAVLLFLVPPAAAHHARPEYDHRSQISIDGTVTDFRMINPHAWIDVEVELPDGATEQWSFEGDSVSRLAREGWDAEILQPGDRVTVLYNPRRDGGPGGVFQGVTMPDGEFHSAAARSRTNLPLRRRDGR